MCILHGPIGFPYVDINNITQQHLQNAQYACGALNSDAQQCKDCNSASKRCAGSRIYERKAGLKITSLRLQPSKNSKQP